MVLVLPKGRLMFGNARDVDDPVTAFLDEAVDLVINDSARLDDHMRHSQSKPFVAFIQNVFVLRNGTTSAELACGAGAAMSTLGRYRDILVVRSGCSCGQCQVDVRRLCLLVTTVSVGASSQCQGTSLECTCTTVLAQPFLYTFAANWMGISVSEQP